jgi:hypothetical protein
MRHSKTQGVKMKLNPAKRTVYVTQRHAIGSDVLPEKQEDVLVLCVYVPCASTNQEAFDRSSGSEGEHLVSVWTRTEYAQEPKDPVAPTTETYRK